MNCEYCQSPVHIWFQCPKKPDGWKPARLAKKSTAQAVAKKVVNNTHGTKPLSTMGANPTTNRSVEAVALPVDTNSEPLTLPVGEKQPRTSQPQGTRNEGMPTKFDKKTWQRNYMRSFMRQYRADVKAGKRVPKKRGEDDV